MSAWWSSLPLSAAAFFLAAACLVISLLALFLDAWLDGSEMRAIRRKRRKERQIIISARELAKHRQDITVQTSRAFMRAFRETQR